MLLRANLLQAQRLSSGNLGQSPALAFLVLFVVFAIRCGGGQLVNAQVAVELLDRAAGAEGVFAGANVDGGLVKNRGQHLRSHEPLPDQLIKLEEIVVHILAHVLGRARDVGGAHSLVRLLGVFLRLVEIRLFGQIVCPKPLRDKFADLREGVT